MFQASCIYLGLITPCLETFHPLHLPGTYHPLLRGLIIHCPKPPIPCSTTNAISSKEHPKHPAWLTFPYRFHKPPFKYEASLIPLAHSLVIRPTVAPPCLNKGNLSQLRSSSFLHCLLSSCTLHNYFEIHPYCCMLFNSSYFLLFCSILYACVLSCFSRVRRFATLWTVACQAPQSLGFSRQ